MRRPGDRTLRWRASALALLWSAIGLQGLDPSPVSAEGLPGRRLDDIYLNASFLDGYWEWHRRYLDARDDTRRRTTEIRLQLAVLASERKALRAEWLRLLYTENQLTPASEYDHGWTGYLGELAGELRREVDDFAFSWSLGLWGAPLAPEVADPSLVQTYQTRRDELRARINELKERQSELIDEAWRLNRELEQLCGEQKERSGDRRPWLNAEHARLDDELTVLEVQLYDAAQWYLPDELPALVDRLDLDTTATEEVALLLRAKVSLAEAAWNDEKSWLQMTSPRKAPPDPEWVEAARAPRLKAIVDLRRVIEINPGNADARGMLMEQELYWLREIAAKLDLESRASTEAFRQYLTARGFSADQPQGWPRSAYEVITAIWGLGPIALSAGLPGINVAEARATELDVTQTTAARSQVALLATMRLVRNGVPLAEIPSMTTAEVARRMTLHTADGRPLPADRARRIVQDIHDTLGDLDDLRLLASADPQHLVEDVNRAYGKAYFAPLDPTYTWYESVGDLLNVHNVSLLWGPGAVAKIDGKWAGLRSMTGSEIQAMEHAGTLITGRQLLLSSTGLTRLAETISSTSLGSRLATAVAADRAAMSSGGIATTLANMGARLSSAMILYAGATYLGTEAGIPGAGLLVEILGELGPVQLLSDVIVRTQVPLEELASRIDEFGEFLARQHDELAAARKPLLELAELTEEMSEEAVDAARRSAIQARLGAIVGEVEEAAAARPGSSVAEPVDQATVAAAKALQRGNVAEARQAVRGGLDLATQAGARVDAAIVKTAKAKGAVSGGNIAESAATRARSPYDMYPDPEGYIRDLPDHALIDQNLLDGTGYSGPQMDAMRALAREENIIIGTRTTNMDSMTKIRDGIGVPKPLTIKAKTIGDLDVYLGASAADKGLVGYFRPRQPSRSQVPPHLWEKVQKRYLARLKEYSKLRDDISALVSRGEVVVKDGKIHKVMDDGGLRPFAGDVDPVYFRDAATGELLTGDRYLQVRRRFMESGAMGQHGAEANLIADLTEGTVMGTPEFDAALKKARGVHAALSEPHVDGTNIIIDIGPEGHFRRGARLTEGIPIAEIHRGP